MLSMTDHEIFLKAKHLSGLVWDFNYDLLLATENIHLLLQGVLLLGRVMTMDDDSVFNLTCFPSHFEMSEIIRNLPPG